MSAPTVNFAAGSLIVPMDTDFQDAGMLTAYGLLDKLLRAGVPVRWCIKTPKIVVDAARGRWEDDFTASATDFQSGAAINAHGYRGGPFVIDSQDAATAAPLIADWQAHKTPVTVVHIASATFSAQVSRVLRAAPRVGVLADGNDAIAYSYLNTAGIPDETGAQWNGRSPDVVTTAAVAGPSMVDHADGALFRPSGLPAFCEIMTMHYQPDTYVSEVAAELTSFMQYPVHVNAECLAVNAIEGVLPNANGSGDGHFAASGGFAFPPPAQPSGPWVFSSVYLPVMQMDGAFANVSGIEPAFSLNLNSSFYDADLVMIRPASAPGPGFADVWMTGYVFGSCSIAHGCQGDVPRGVETYLGGHQYPVTTPITKSPATNGARLFLNSLFLAGCTSDEGAPSIRVTATIPATTDDPQVSYTLDWKNDGPGPAYDAVLTSALPPGASFVSATGGGTNNNGTVRFPLGDLRAGQSGTVSITVRLAAPGRATVSGTLAYTVGLNTQKVQSADASIVYGAAEPVVSIVASAPPTTSAPTLAITLAYQNSGLGTARALVVSNPLPVGTAFVSADGGGTLQNGVVTWNVGDVPAHGGGTLTLTVSLGTYGTYTDTAVGTFGDGQTLFPVQSNIARTVFGAPQPLLQVDASAPQATALPTVRFTIPYANVGTGDALSVSVSDVLPPNAVFVAADGGGVYANGAVSWNLGTVAGGQGGALHVDVKLATYGSYPNQATATFSDGNGDASTLATNTTLTVYGPGAPNVQLRASAPTLAAQATVTFHVDYTNFGGNPASNVIVSDVLPLGATFIAATHGGTFDGAAVTWNLGTLGLGDSGALEVTLVLPAPGNYPNAPTVAFTAPNGDPKSAVGNTTNTYYAPSVSVVVGAPATTAVPGVTFTIGYANNAQVDASNVIVSDPLPAGALFVRASNGGHYQNGVVSWSLGSVPPGATGSLTVDLVLASPGAWKNQAHATYTLANQPLSVDSNGTSTQYDGPSIQLQASGPGITVDGQATYTVSYTNAGLGTAIAFTIADDLPVGATFVKASNGGVYANGRVTWALGDQPFGTSGSVSVSVQLPAPGTYTDGASATYTVGTTTATVQAPTVGTVFPAPGLVLLASAPTLTNSGAATFRIDYSNTGQGTAQGLVISDVLPLGSSVTSVSGNGMVSMGTVSFSVGDVLAGGSGSVSVTVQLPPYGIYTNHATGTFTAGNTPQMVQSNTTSTAYPPPALVLTAQAPATSAVPTVTYTIGYENDGNADCQGMVLTDVLPPGAAFVSATGAATFANGVVSWKVGTVPTGSSGSFTLTLTLPAPGTYTNQATATYTITNVPQVVTSNTTSTIYSAPAISVNLDCPIVNGSATVTCTGLYQNTGNLPANNVTLTDDLPPGAQFVAVSGGGGIMGSTITWFVGNVAPGMGGKVSVTFTLLGAGSFTDIIHYTFLTSGTPATGSSNLVRIVYDPPALTVVIHAPAITLTDELTYVIDYVNPGPGTAVSGAVGIGLPANETFVRASFGAMVTNNIVVWNLGDVPPATAGTETVTVRLAAPGTYTASANSAYLVGLGQRSSFSLPVTTIYPPAGLSLIASAPDTVAAPVVTFTIQYANTGMATAQALVIHDTLPMGATFVAASGGGTQKGGVVSFIVGNVPGGASGAVFYTARLGAFGTYANTASGSYTNGMAMMVQSNTTQTVYQAPSLDLRASAPAIITSPQASFTITYRNSGAVSLDGLGINDKLPQGAQFVSADSGGVYSNGVVRWSLGSLLPGIGGTLGVVVKFGSPDTYTNQAAAGFLVGNTPGSAISNATDTVYSPPGLILTSDGPALAAGATVSYHLGYVNSGTSTASGVVLTDTLPTNASFLNASNGGTYAAGKVSYVVGDVPPGGSGSVLCTVALPAPGSYQNQGSAAFSVMGMPATALSNITDTTFAAPGLVLVASGPATVTAADITYRIDYENTGFGGATQVVVRDLLPPGATFVAASGNGTYAGGAVQWTLGDLVPGMSGVLTVRAKLPGQGAYSNQAVASFLAGNAPQAASSNIVDTTYAPPALTLTLDAPASTNAAAITYTIHYANDGAVPLTGVTLVDVFPPGLTLGAISGGGVAVKNTVSFALGMLAPGDSGSFTVAATLGGPGIYTDQVGAAYTADTQALESTSNVVSTYFGVTEPDAGVPWVGDAGWPIVDLGHPVDLEPPPRDFAGTDIVFHDLAVQDQKPVPPDFLGVDFYGTGGPPDLRVVDFAVDASPVDFATAPDLADLGVPDLAGPRDLSVASSDGRCPGCNQPDLLGKPPGQPTGCAVAGVGSPRGLPRSTGTLALGLLAMGLGLGLGRRRARYFTGQR